MCGEGETVFVWGHFIPSFSAEGDCECQWFWCVIAGCYQKAYESSSSDWAHIGYRLLWCTVLEVVNQFSRPGRRDPGACFHYYGSDLSEPAELTQQPQNAAGESCLLAFTALSVVIQQKDHLSGKRNSFSQTCGSECMAKKGSEQQGGLSSPA